MEKKNNFEKVFEHEAPESLKESSLKNAQGSIHAVKSFFDVLDLYISKFFGAIIYSFKDNSSSIQYGIGTGLDQTAEEVEELEDEDLIDLINEDEEDWNSDSDLPKDL